MKYNKELDEIARNSLCSFINNENKIHDRFLSPIEKGTEFAQEIKGLQEIIGKDKPNK
jgi:hypothetical protein